MTLRNRTLVRTPVGMLRANPIEQEDLDFLVEHYGGEASAVFRDVLLEKARALRHAKNPMASTRLDRNAFSGFQAA